jgi:hypothetical protein
MVIVVAIEMMLLMMVAIVRMLLMMVWMAVFWAR